MFLKNNKSILVIIIILFSINISVYSQDDSLIIKEKYNAYIVENEDEGIDGGYLVKKGKKYGVVDYDYNLKIPIKYNSIKYCGDYNEYYLVNRKKYFGVYNIDLEEKLKCKYLRIIDKENVGMEIKSKKGVGLYSLYYNKMLLEDIYDSIVVDEERYYDTDGEILVYKDNKVGIFVAEGHDKFLFKVEWDSIKVCYDEINDIEGNYYDYYYLLKRNDSIFYFTGDHNNNYQIITEGYSNANTKRMTQLKADTIALDGNNGDGLFKARNSDTKKWGMYQDYGDSIHIVIPADYDSVYYFGWNYPYTTVFNEGLVGIYLWDWYGDDSTYTSDCIYEDYKRVNGPNERKYFAGKINGKWYWIDWYTGKKTRDLGYDTYDDMKLYPIDRSSFYDF